MGGPAAGVMRLRDNSAPASRPSRRITHEYQVRQSIDTRLLCAAGNIKRRGGIFAYYEFFKSPRWGKRGLLRRWELNPARLEVAREYLRLNINVAH
jgi:hypothetical protein